MIQTLIKIFIKSTFVFQILTKFSKKKKKNEKIGIILLLNIHKLLFLN